jgi:hypothetical protein
MSHHAMRLFTCPVCRQQVYFDNTVCLACGSEIAFAPERLKMVAIDAAPHTHRTCVQRASPQACNWAIEAADPIERCRSCRLTGAASAVGAEALRSRAEAAKRQVLYTLLQLGVPFAAKLSDADRQGLRFVWASPGPDASVLTGHHDGTIVLNLNEADDAHREAARVSFGEPQRTVLGHLRHELSHYLFQRLIDGTAEIATFREHFGDERADYPQALQRHYEFGPPAEWQHRFVSAYASAHPWEDWAETCAHYLLMIEAVDTAAAWGLQLSPADGARVQPDPAAARLPVERLVVDHWLPMARFLNAMARSLGLADSYPYLLPPPVLDKLRFVQRTLTATVA